MKNILKNKKGFTLVELLAVIVILALIMSIAIISMNGIMQGARYDTMKETGLQIINGVRQQLTLSNELPMENGDTVYCYFSEAILSKGGKTSPLGGTFKYYTGTPDPTDGPFALGYTGVFKVKTSTALACTEGSGESYVKAVGKGNGKSPEFSICLITNEGGNYYINDATEASLSSNRNDGIVKGNTSNGG